MVTRNVVGVACAIVLVLGGHSRAAAPEAVGIRLFQFRPGGLEVKPGSRVTWRNDDDITHTVTSGTPEARDARFDRRLEGKGATATVEFTTPGTYPYFCDRHPSMRGQIRVN